VSRLELRPIHPGEILKEQVEELGMSARALAVRLGVPTNRVTGVLNETRSITPGTALRLAKLFGGGQDGARFWLNLQQAYDLRRAELEAEQEGYLEAIEPVRVPAVR
jgi:addiction module HigA family antidote